MGIAERDAVYERSFSAVHASLYHAPTIMQQLLGSMANCSCTGGHFMRNNILSDMFLPCSGPLTVRQSSLHL